MGEEFGRTRTEGGGGSVVLRFRCHCSAQERRVSDWGPHESTNRNWYVRSGMGKPRLAHHCVHESIRQAKPSNFEVTNSCRQAPVVSGGYLLFPHRTPPTPTGAPLASSYTTAGCILDSYSGVFLPVLEVVCELSSRSGPNTGGVGTS